MLRPSEPASDLENFSSDNSSENTEAVMGPIKDGWIHQAAEASIGEHDDQRAPVT